jgi:hypothetical protein
MTDISHLQSTLCLYLLNPFSQYIHAEWSFALDYIIKFNNNWHKLINLSNDNNRPAVK